MSGELLTHTFLGKRYIICYGQCDSPDTINKTITVPTTGETLLDLHTIIHESLHACDWGAEEDKVEEVSEKVAKEVWDEGYRKSNRTKNKKIANYKNLAEIIYKSLLNLKWSEESEIVCVIAYDIARFLNRIGWRASYVIKKNNR